uniref:Small ribosomal subunit protein uS14 n=1 Tax=Suricata suricatta TaxID=37032 RepID=A0A673TE34_SURSU
MGHQQLYWSHPRKFGQGSRSCRVCSNRHGLIRKYGLNMCRQCFRQYAKDIGFIKAPAAEPWRVREELFCSLLQTSTAPLFILPSVEQDSSCLRISCSCPSPHPQFKASLHLPKGFSKYYLCFDVFLL